MTNYERWHNYMRHVGSPEIFIDFGYYSLISSCLQRRVWVGPMHNPIFGNMYIVLCAEPGIGKGQVIKPITALLSHWKVYNSAEQEMLKKEQEKQVERGKRVDPSIFSKPYGAENGMSKKLHDEPMLFPIASDSFGSYQALVKAMAESYDAKVIKTVDGKSGTYLHSSMSFNLEELASLFRRNTDDLVNFLLQAYDCGDYRYETIQRQKDRIKNCCLNLLAGTTPSFMQQTLDDRITNEGLASRTFFICADKNRSSDFETPELDQEQVQARLEILQHIRKLKELYGGCSYAPDALAYLTEWWKHFPDSPRPNSSPKLAAYYARKKLHVQKLALAIHYGEHLNNVITLHEVKRAMKMLDEAEMSMHLALTFRGANKLTQLTRALEAFLGAKGASTKDELTTNLWDYCPNGLNDINQVLEALSIMKKVECAEGKDKKVRWQLRKSL